MNLQKASTSYGLKAGMSDPAAHTLLGTSEVLKFRATALRSAGEVTGGAMGLRRLIPGWQLPELGRLGGVERKISR